MQYNATPERTFSHLKTLKTYLLWSTVGEERLNGLALANVNKSVLDHDDIEKNYLGIYPKKSPMIALSFRLNSNQLHIFFTHGIIVCEFVF